MSRHDSPRRFRSLCVLAVLATLVSGKNAIADDATEAYSEPPITEDDRQHWSFRPLNPGGVPAVADSSWCRNDVDRFVLHKLTEHKLQPQPQASRRTLIRRLSFDLTGLPPTPEELEAFLQDTAADAVEQLIDRLLASPRYGERWAQHWLDLARFAETDGFEHDKVRPEAWKYRDWVIKAFNDDMPYDEFLKQQIAGDELYPDKPSTVTATRFCLSGPDMPDINLTEERRHTVLNELTSTVGEVVLGLQIGCAQCHNHKYDAISQADFYRFRAIFEPALKLTKNKSLSVLNETVPWQKTSHVMRRGDFRSPETKIQPGVLRVVGWPGHVFEPQKSGTTNGRRTALAEWLVSRDNPLTARVIANRIWQHHFGTGLVSTPSDFGIMGQEPSHPKLLDWLAFSLIDDGWSLKKLHRKIVASATYRQRSRLPDDASESQQHAWSMALEADPHAELLSRFPRFRLEGEAIRDAMLASSGKINFKTGGPGVRPPLPAELVSTLLKNQWTVTEDKSEHSRRSIYVFARRNLKYPMFEVFDRPSANASCPERNVSTTAPQSLHLLNSQFTLNTAKHLARMINGATSDRNKQIVAAFERTLGRPPTDQETQHVNRFWTAQQATGADSLTHLCLSLFNSNEFIVVD